MNILNRRDKPEGLSRLIQGVLFFLLQTIPFLSCSFDYSPITESEETRPDLVMEDVDYNRVADGKLVIHFQADQVARFEKNRLLQVQNLRFEQFNKNTGQTDAAGTAGYAQFWTATSDAEFSDGVRIIIPSEDLSVEAKSLQWKDMQKVLFGSPDQTVLLKKSDGSLIVGSGFSADGRSRSWRFTGSVSGMYQEESTP